MKKRYKSLISGIAVLAMLASLTACGGKKGTDAAGASTAGENSAVSTTQTSKEVKTLSYMVQTASLSTGLKASIDYVNSKSDEVGAKLEVEKLPDGDQGEQVIQARYASGEVPDLLYFQPVAYANTRMNVEKNFVDISDMDFSSIYDDSYIKSPGYLLNGKMYEVPIATGGGCFMFYNKKVLADAGVTTVPKGWDAFLKACEAVRAKGIDPVFYSAKDTWTLQIMPLTGWYTDYKPEEATQFSKEMETNKKHWVDMKGFIDSLDKTKELLDKGYVQKTYLSDTYQQAQQALLDGKTAFYAQGSWVISELMKISADKTNNDIGAFLIPLTDNPYQGIGASQGTYVSLAGKDVALAKKVLAALVSVESQNEFFKAQPDIPMAKGVTVDLKGPNLDIKKEIDAAPKSPQWTDFCKYQKGPMETYIAEMLVGGKTSKQVAEALDKDFAKAAKAKNDPNWK